MSWLDEELERGPVLFDGGMGTMLFSAGLQPGSCTEIWNTERPQDVEKVHCAYVESGTKFLTTNTFGGSALGLARHGLDGRTAELNRAAVEVAQKAAPPGGRIIGDVGPFGGFLEPYGDATASEVRRSFERQVEALASAGVDAILVESMVDPDEACLAIAAAKDVASLPIFATFTFERHSGRFCTMMGASPTEMAERAIAAGAEAIGANCGTHLSLGDYLELAAELIAAAGDRPVLLQPNAGSPEFHDGKAHYPATANEFAEWAVRAVEAGVKVVGGCCGTTPAHIAAMAAALGM